MRYGNSIRHILYATFLAINMILTACAMERDRVSSPFSVEQQPGKQQLESVAKPIGIYHFTPSDCGVGNAERLSIDIAPTDLAIYTFSGTSSSETTTSTPSDCRANNPQLFFSHEYSQINARKSAQQNKDAKRPEKLIGLAFSGGGIRSNAFHLGVLSGLNRNKEPDSCLRYLDCIDYISAVSGGSWAAGAYKAYDLRDEELFQELDDYVKNESAKLCDASLFTVSGGLATKSLGFCTKDAARFLLNSYEQIMAEVKKATPLTDLFDLSVGYKGREAWRGMIQKNFLLMSLEPGGKEGDPRKTRTNDVLLSKLEDPPRNNRPYLIINASHDSYVMTPVKKPASNFPFEITAKRMGTIADCGNAPYWQYCYIPSWLRAAVPGLRTGGAVFADTKEHFSTLYLSHALAISGAVLPERLFFIPADLMEWKIDFPLAPDKRLVQNPWYREYFLLSDGGHSENLGALPLIERGVDLIIISDIALDPDYRFGDYRALKEHAKNLLGIDMYVWNHDDSGKTPEKYANRPKSYEYLEMKHTAECGALKNENLYKRKLEFKELENSEEPENSTEQSSPAQRDKKDRDKKDKETYEGHMKKCHPDEYNFFYNVGQVYHGCYGKNVASAEECEKNVGAKTILYIKPPTNLKAFYKYLDEKGCPHIHNYLVNNETDFPADKTFAITYDSELIFAYYMLGKFVAEKQMAPEIENFLKKKGDKFAVN